VNVAAAPSSSSSGTPYAEASEIDVVVPIVLGPRSLLNGRVSVVVVDPGERADSVFASKGCAQADSWV
jgi:hypothetical protein